MKFLHLTLILATLFMFASRVEADCEPSSCGCKAAPNDFFCGDGTLGCIQGHIYQCEYDGRSCDFGPRYSCSQCNKVKC